MQVIGILSSSIDCLTERCGGGTKAAVLGGAAAICAISIAGYMIAGAVHSPLYALFGIDKPQTVVKGFVAPGYESVS
jgi:hypothetical protein